MVNVRRKSIPKYDKRLETNYVDKTVLMNEDIEIPKGTISLSVTNVDLDSYGCSCCGSTTVDDVTIRFFKPNDPTAAIAKFKDDMDKYHDWYDSLTQEQRESLANRKDAYKYDAEYTAARSLLASVS